MNNRERAEKIILFFTRECSFDKHKRYIELITAELEAVRLETLGEALFKVARAAESVGRLWFDPKKENAACILCDANMYPNTQGVHMQRNGKPCPLKILHDALKEAGLGDAE